jgi:hypothetical protein
LTQRPGFWAVVIIVALFILNLLVW